ncbi:MAG TPA: ATP-binding cassette domain-containing protein [Bacteroidota bacterium]|nr:ATP-binding cassette domain-containing protein [Bacteroidota bacterium]
MIKAQNLHKQYENLVAVEDVSLEVGRGKIFGLIGPNGAGKTTTIRMLLNIISPDRGSVTFDGVPFNQTMRDRIGYLPEERGLYKKNKLIDTILYFASLRGLQGSSAKETAMEWLRRFELERYAKRKVEELSKGNQQKVQFITSILHNPDYVVLDEPFSGLDPVNQIVLKEILQELKKQGKAIIFSTHQMDSAEKLCDEICLVNRGNIVLEGAIKEVKQKFGKNAVRVEFVGDGSFIASLPEVKKAMTYENYVELQLNGNVSSKSLLSAISSKVDIRKFEFVEPSLNSIFLDVIGVPDETRQTASTKPAASLKPATVAGDKRVRNSMLMFVVFLVAALVVGVINLKKGESNWNGPLLLMAGAIYSFIKYLKMKKKVTLEMQQLAPGGADAE